MKTIFNEFYQKEIPEEDRIIGFKTTEIKKILDDHFIFDVTLGFYYSFDTWIECKDFYVSIDKKWFGLFYRAVRKNSEPINKISEIKVYKKDNEYFRKFTLLQEDIPFYVNLALTKDNFDEFFEKVKNKIISSRK